ncbi:MAG: FeoB small GTPase domain-containing protein, partial [Saccharofermentanales bacterium]
MAKESLTFALMGNQNSGKTTLFNRLTGSQLHVSNFPGVTVERKSGRLREYPDSEIVDLPGIYSLSPYSPEEVIRRNFLINEKPDCIL